MTSEHIKKLLAEGEGLTVEFKECVNELSNSVWETVCSFSNRYGGHLLLGVTDDGKVIGVNPRTAQQMKKNFANTLNNPQRFCPTLFVSLEEAVIDDKLMLWVYIPVNSRLAMFANRIYDRAEDGDLDITRNSDAVAQIHARKSGEFSERKIFPYATLDDLELDRLMPKVRRLIQGRRADHPWLELTDMEILQSAGLYQQDRETGKAGFNLAAILLLGREDVIRSCTANYLTDAIYRVEDLDRYDDRRLVRANLIDAYEQLIDFINNHTLDRFFLIDDQSVSVRSKIARELVSNSLVHREYTSAYPAKIVIERDKVVTENWNIPKNPGRINPEDFTPYPKNPLLANFFVQIGRADTLGSGVRNLYKYTKIYSGEIPELIDGDVFKTTVPLGMPPTTVSDHAGMRYNVSDKMSSKPGMSDKMSDKPGVSDKMSDKPGMSDKMSDKPGVSDKMSDKMSDKTSDKPGMSDKMSDKLEVSDQSAMSDNTNDIPHEKKLMVYMQAHGAINTQTAAQIIGRAPETARRVLGGMVAKGDVVIEGGNRNRTYRLVNR
jgi:ATP-dependent DNA helicase RecG